MMYQHLVLLMLCVAALCSSAKLVGAPSPLREKDFYEYQLDKVSNAKLLEMTDNDQPSVSFYKYLCGTKQLVSGMIYEIEFQACVADEQGNCSASAPKSLCTFEIWSQPWLVEGGDAMKTLKPLRCRPTQEAQCDLPELTTPRRPKRDLSQGPIVMEKPDFYDDDIVAIFNRFIDEYKKDYSKDRASETYRMRYKIFEKNLKIIQELNRVDEGTAVYGITEFTDYSDEEYRRYLAPGFSKKLVDIREIDLNDLDTSNMPSSFDWREKGAVTAVKNQGQCGSCWAFSTTGNIEGQWFIKKKNLVSLSEQELVDCDALDQGCDGGLPSNAYKSIEKLGGLETEKDYPYAAEDEKCDIKRSEIRVYINDSVALPTDETKLAAWLAQYGPISIGINANMMQFYFGGISHPWRIFCNPNNLDHGVLIVGYGTENGTPYWIIKNSWGASWGEKGYYRIYRGDGSCGVNKMPTSSIID